MSQASPISIVAYVSEGEREAVQLATAHLARALSKAAGSPWPCDCVFAPDMATLQKQGEAGIILTSLLPELEQPDSPWPRTEQRLRTAYAALVQRGVPVFICTILRHVRREEDPQSAALLRIRIRRLNLLAAEISRETKAGIIDLDRVLADIGARRLQTDYRLGTPAAAQVVGHFIARTLLNNAVDTLVPFEIQDAASAVLNSDRPGPSIPGIPINGAPLPAGQERRQPHPSPVIHKIENGYDDLAPQPGSLGPAQALHRLVQAVRRYGFRETVSLLALRLSKQMNRRK